MAGSATVKITAKAATITVTNASKTYGESDPAFTGTVEGLVSATDLGTISYVRTNATVNNVGTYDDVLTASYTANSNYAVTVVPGDFEITAKTATITVADASKTYGATDPTFTGTVEGLVSASDLGTISYSRTGSDENVGTYDDVLTAEYTPNSNYSVTVVPGDFTINPASMSITVNGSNTSKVYNGSLQNYTGTVTATSTTEGFDDSKFSYSGSTTVSGTNVGEYTMALAAASCAYNDNNYTVAWTIGDPVKLIITPATTEVTATGYEQAYDGVAHSITVTAPSGATVTYSTDGTNYSSENPSYSDVGNYTVYYKVVKDN